MLWSKTPMKLNSLSVKWSKFRWREVIVQLASSIVDASGNVTSTFFKNNRVELILDQDQDGIPDEQDRCPDSPANEDVDENGCAESQRDDDNDGVPNGEDLCAETPEGVDVDANGCSALQRDPDQDGIEFPIDECPETPFGQVVDEKGVESKIKIKILMEYPMI